MKITGMCELMMIALVASFLSTGTEAYRPGPKTCDGFSDANGECKVTGNGYQREVYCSDGFIYSEVYGMCVPENQTGIDSRRLKSCRGFSDVNGVCTVNSDGSSASHLCNPGYVLPLDSDKCLSKASVRGFFTCEGFSAPNAACEVIDNGWDINVRCVDGYIYKRHSNKCVLKKSNMLGYVFHAHYKCSPNMIMCAERAKPFA